MIREGDTAIFKCKAEANPGDVSYKWFLGIDETRILGIFHSYDWSSHQLVDP